jgi:hypothetical protein
MGWQKFDSVIDSDEVWIDDAKASNMNEIDYAESTEYNHWLQFNLTTPKAVGTIRLKMSNQQDLPHPCIEAYYGGEWHYIWDGEVESDVMTDPIEINQTISAIRVEESNSDPGDYIRLFEVQYLLSETAAKPLVNGSLARNLLTGGALAR